MSTTRQMEPKPKQPFSRARPRSEFLQRYREREAAKQAELEQQQQQPPAETGDTDFNVESVIISTPARLSQPSVATEPVFRPLTNINYRERPIDKLVREQQERTAHVTFESKTQISVTPKHDSLDLLRKLSRIGTPPSSTAKDDLDILPPSPKIESPSRRISSEPLRPKSSFAARDIPVIFPGTQQTENAPGRILNAPAHPKSALEAVYQEARENKTYGDDTLASLENIIHPNIDPTNSTFNKTDPANNAAEDEVADDLPAAEAARLKEQLALEALNKRLESTASTVKDANRGLRRIENRIDAADTVETGKNVAAASKPAPAVVIEDTTTEQRAQPAKSERAPKITPEPKDAKPTVTAGLVPHLPPGVKPHTDHNDRTICEHCGGRYTSIWRGAWTEFREKFYTYDTKHNNRIRLTWLGWTLILWCIWLLFEAALCTEFCDTLEGPLMPFVTFNLCVRPLIPILRPVFAFLAWSFGSLFNLLFGDLAANNKPATGAAIPTVVRSLEDAGTFGYDIAGSTTSFLRATSTRILQSATQAVDDIGSLWDDELVG